MSPIRSIATQWVVKDGDRRIGTIGRRSDGVYVASRLGDMSDPFTTRTEAVSWLVARDAVSR